MLISELPQSLIKVYSMDESRDIGLSYNFRFSRISQSIK